MIDGVIRELMRDFEFNSGASPHQIRGAEEQLAVRLSAEYVDLVRWTNGGEGCVGRESYLVLWPVEELLERNEGYKVDGEYARGLTLIGTDGGNEAFAVRSSDDHFVSAPLIGMSPDMVVDMGHTLREFLESLP